ncbi:hypothetical protein HYR69_05215 [Candidatus Sumerlaeota bacterium]|nr:hypothetical protein [Candidatus Sumerlaeota bacterium]
MEPYGLWIGLGILAAVTALALLIAARAARGVEQFREEHHASFLGKDRK